MTKTKTNTNTNTKTKPQEVPRNMWLFMGNCVNFKSICMLGVQLLTLNYRNGDSQLSLEEIQDPVIRLVQFLVD